jgi:hypothetical protein
MTDLMPSCLGLRSHRTQMTRATNKQGRNMIALVLNLSQPPFLPNPVPLGRVDCDFIADKIIGSMPKFVEQQIAYACSIALFPQSCQSESIGFLLILPPDGPRS